MEVKEIIAKIKPIDSSLYAKAQKRLDNLTKPKGSLGLLEELAMNLIEAGIKIYNEMATFDEAKVAEAENK